MRSWPYSLILNLLITGILVAGLIILIVIFHSDLYKRAQKIAELRAEVAIRRTAVETLPLMRSDAEKAEPLTERLTSLLPLPNQTIKFSQTLQNLAKQNKLTIALALDKINPTNPEAGHVTTFRIKTTGELSAVIELLKTLQQNENYLMAFPSINISKSGKKFAADFSGELFTR